MLTHTLTRRMLLASSAALALVGCANVTADQIKADVEAIAAGLAGIVATLPGIVPGNILDKASEIISSIEASAALIAQAASPSVSLLNQISAGVAALASILGPFFKQAPLIGAVIQAAIVMVNVVLTAAGIPPPAPIKATARAATMTVDEARLILLNAASGKMK